MVNSNKPISRLQSIQTLFLAAITLLIVVLSLPLLVSGVKIINDLTRQFGQEILTEVLQSLIAPINQRYQTLARVGLEDSVSHRQEIQENGLVALSIYRYKDTGSIFVISSTEAITLSTDFLDSSSEDFNHFFATLKKSQTFLEYRANNKTRIGVATYYQPWDSYIGLAMDQDELFAPRNNFIQINLVVLAIVVIIAGLFALAIHHLLITPILRLTRFADQVSSGNLEAEIPGRFVLELATMRKDIMNMVTTLVSREEKYRAVFNAPADAIFIHDASSGKIIEVNQAMGEMYGYSQEEALTLDIGVLSSGIFPYTSAEAGKHIAMVTPTQAQRFEWHARRKNGELFWVDVALRAFRYGEEYCILAVVRDIEAQKNAALDLAAEKEQLAITLRSIGEGVITTDSQGVVVLINKVAESLTGWTQEEAAGRPLLEIFHILNAKNDEICPDPAQEVLKSGQHVGFTTHTVLVARDGTRRDIANSAAPIYNPGSVMVGVVIVFRDITEKQRMEKELHKIQKLESVGILAGGIAHDFNNLLAAILGNINLARLSTQGDTPLDKLLSEAEKASVRAKNLTQQLLTFSKGGEPVRQTTDLCQIISDNAAFILRGSSTDYQFDPPQDLWPVNIDPGQIGQVIQNIILNASQAMETQGGHIEIVAKNCQNCTENEVLADSCVHVTISDNGPGMPHDVLDRIFDPYFTTKDTGSGLGLAVCHSIIKKHEGLLRAHSEVGKGTVFTLKLPVSRQPQAPSPAPHEKKAYQEALKILVMDDEEILRDLAIQIFRALGHEAEAVADGATALAIYQQAMSQGAPFDLVLMDLTIPGGMGGKEAVAKILEIDGAAKVIVASGYSNDPVMANFRQYGFAGMLEKPFRMSDLEKVIAEIL